MGFDCVGRGKAAHCVQTHRSASESFVGSAREHYVVGHQLCNFTFRHNPVLFLITTYLLLLSLGQPFIDEDHSDCT